eukprot:jgi/Botrbrau1/6899/Bobra.67_3s0018.1
MLSTSRSSAISDSVACDRCWQVIGESICMPSYPGTPTFNPIYSQQYLALRIQHFLLKSLCARVDALRLVPSHLHLGQLWTLSTFSTSARDWRFPFKVQQFCRDLEISFQGSAVWQGIGDFFSRFYKRAAAGCLRAVAKHSAPLAQALVDCGAVEALVTCLEEFDPGVKEAASWCLGYIASHTPELARQVVAAGAVPLLVLTGQEPELFLKRIAASALSDVAKHDPELAQAVVDAGAVPLLSPLVVSPEPRLRRNACCALAQVAKHSVDLAEVVVEADLFPRVLTCLKFPDDGVRKYGATAVREVRRVNSSTNHDLLQRNPVSGTLP